MRRQIRKTLINPLTFALGLLDKNKVEPIIKKAGSREALKQVDHTRPVEAEAVARFLLNMAFQEPVSGMHLYESNVTV